MRLRARRSSGPPVEPVARTWRTAESIAPPAHDGWRVPRIVAAATISLVSSVVLLYSWARVGLKCGEDCYGRSPRSDFGSVTFQPGHHWTRYADSWQWGAQNGIAHLAVLAAVVGIGLALLAKRDAAPAFAVAACAATGWILWVAWSPAMS